MSARKPDEPWIAKPAPPVITPSISKEQWEDIKQSGDIGDDARGAIEVAIYEFQTYTKALKGKPSPSVSAKKLQSLRIKVKELHTAFQDAGDDVKELLLEAISATMIKKLYFYILDICFLFGRSQLNKTIYLQKLDTCSGQLTYQYERD